MNRVFFLLRYDLKHHLEQHRVQYHETSLIISEKERRSETIPSNEIIPSLLSFLSQDFSGSAGQRSSKRKEGKEPPLEKGRRTVAWRWRRFVKARRERAREPPVGHLRRSSISDKNKVNGEWGCRRGGCSNGQAGVKVMGEGDASPTGPYQSERGEAKSTTIDATGHTVYNERRWALYFSFFPLPFPHPSIRRTSRRFSAVCSTRTDIAAFAIYVYIYIYVFRISMKEAIWSSYREMNKSVEESG